MNRPGTGSRSGFTLLEVILALGLMTMILAALYQALATHTRANQLVETEVRRTSRSRALLHRIGMDLRSVAGPLEDRRNSGSRPAPAGAVRLLQLDPNATTGPQPAGAAGIGDPNLWPAGADAADRGQTAADSPESTASDANAAGGFSLLGTSDRLLLRVNAWEIAMAGPAEADQSTNAVDAIGSQTERTGAAAGGSSRRPLRVPAARQILYLFNRPRRDAAASGSNRPSADSTAGQDVALEEIDLNRRSDSADGPAEEIERPGPLYRQAVALPFDSETWIRLEADLTEFLSPADNKGIDLPENADSLAGFEGASSLRSRLRGSAAGAGLDLTNSLSGPTGETALRSGGDSMPLGVILTEEVVDLRFRYFDGFGWRDRWDRADRLPHAVEIAVRFIDDPPPAEEEEASSGLAAPPALDELELDAGLQSPSRQRRRWFSSRLVVSLTPAASAPEFDMQDSITPGSPLAKEAP